MFVLLYEIFNVGKKNQLHAKVVLVKSLFKEAKNEFNNVGFRDRNLSVYVMYISCSPVSLVFRN